MTNRTGECPSWFDWTTGVDLVGMILVGAAPVQLFTGSRIPAMESAADSSDFLRVLSFTDAVRNYA